MIHDSFNLFCKFWAGKESYQNPQIIQKLIQKKRQINARMPEPFYQFPLKYR